MKTKIHFFVMFCFIASYSAISQTVTRVNNSNISGATCPGIGIDYQVSVPDGFTACHIDWTATHGATTINQSDQTKVSVIWDDTPGATGTITATFSSCTGNESNNGTTASLSELILSVKDQSFGATNNPVSLDYCNTKTVIITVPYMYVQGTGGIAQPPLQQVAYSWTLPSGWVADGNVYNTSLNGITIHATACAVPGTVSVVGVINDWCGSAAPSASLNISLSGHDPSVTFTVPQGYAGSTACNTNPVTFTAIISPSLGCVSGYDWSQHPSGWTLIGTSSNTATFQPSGTAADHASGNDSPFAVKVSFSCGSTITSGSYNPSWNPPSMSGPSEVCSSGTSFSVTNVSSQAYPITWSSSNTGVVYFPNPTSATTSNTVNLVQYANGSATLTATTSCGVPASKPVGVGSPIFNSVAVNGNTGPWPVCTAGNIPYAAGPDEIVITTSTSGSSSTTFSLNDPSQTIVGAVISPTQYGFIVKRSDLSFTVTLSSTNSCETISQCLRFSNSSCVIIPAFTSVTVDGAPAQNLDCTTGNTFNTGTHTVTATANTGSAVTFALGIMSGTATGSVLSSTQYQFTAKSSASFFVRMYSSNSCGNAATCIFFCNGSSCIGERIANVPSDIYPPEIEADLPTISELTAYPNPTSDRLTIAVPVKAEEDIPVVLYDRNGTSLNTTYIKKGEWKVEMSLGSFGDGLYLIRIDSKLELNTTKVVVGRK